MGLRTRIPYRIQVIDDASSDGTVQYLQSLLIQDKIANVLFNKKRCGIPSHLRMLCKITNSNPIVFTDDDVLCPKLEPDWLEQGVKTMKEFPEIGLLGLNTPQCNIGDKRGKLNRKGKVTFCRNVAGHFVFARRELLEKLTISDGKTSPVKAICFQTPKFGYKVGYLTNVWCQHIGTFSIRVNKDLSKVINFIKPINLDTLEPPDKYKG